MGGKKPAPAAHPDTADDQFAVVLSAAIRRRGLTLDRIRHRLQQAGAPVSGATLSYWQSGRSKPGRSSSRPALAALEEILGLEHGTLTSLAGLDAPKSWDELIPESRVIEETMAARGVRSEEFSKIWVHDILTIDEHRHERTFHSRWLVRADVEGAVSVILANWEPPTGATSRIVSMRNCSIGEVAHVPERELAITELRLPRALHLGEMMHMELVEEYSACDEESTLLRHDRPPRPGTLATILEVDFHPDALPAEVRAHEYRQGREERIPVQVHANSAQHVFLGQEHGLTALSWDWTSSPDA